MKPNPQPQHRAQVAGRHLNQPFVAAVAVALAGLVTLAIANSGGTLAQWSATAETPGGVVLAGDLNIVPCADQPDLRWVETSADVANPRSSQAGDRLVDFAAMPGDSVLLTQCVEVTLGGDNLASAVEVTAWADDPALGLVSKPGPGLEPDPRITGTYAIKDLADGSYPDVYYAPADPSNPPVSQAGSPPTVGDSVYVLIPASPFDDPGRSDGRNSRTLRWEVEITIGFEASYSAPGQLAFDSIDFGYDDAYQDLKPSAPVVSPAAVALVQFGIAANQVNFGEGWAP